MTHQVGVSFSEREMELIRRVADLKGITVEEAATELMRGQMARRFRRGTGYAPAKVYSLADRRKH